MAAERITPTEGQRLHAFIEQHWTRADGGISALAKRAGLRRPTLYAWFRGADAPNMASLKALASALGVRRVDLIAAMDGLTAPNTEEAAPPDDRMGRIENLLLLLVASQEDDLSDDDYLRKVDPKAAELVAEARRILAESPDAAVPNGT